jgi:fermentation-respiration switch protein FrsA (DUF1100 family)
MKSNVTFKNEGLNIAGWLFTPDKSKHKHKRNGTVNDQNSSFPAIVMAHGLTGVKEMYLEPIAEKLCNAGYVVIVFDYRYSGASEGEPRGQIFWEKQIEDYKAAISYVSQLDSVDENRIAVWGTSYSGAHVLWLGAFDPRVKAVYSQVPATDVFEIFLRFNTPGEMQGLRQYLYQDHFNRFQNPNSINYLPASSPDGKNAVMIGVDVYEWLKKAAETVAPNFLNKITVESIEHACEYNAGAIIHRVSPIPLLMVVCQNDSLTPVDIQIEAFQRAREPKQLHVLPASHFEIYSDPWQSKATQWAIEWFDEHV